MKVSVIIPTYNEEKNIEEAISSLLNQTYKDFEVIIVDDGSKDGTVNKVKDFMKRSKKVRLIKGEHKGPGFSRNLGAKNADGEILVFVDADMSFEKEYLEFLTKPIREKSSIGAEERYQKASNLTNVWSRCWGQYTKGDRMNTEGKGLVFRAILASKFHEFGGFDPSYGYADDLTFYFKYGVKPDIADKAFCYHKNPASLREVYQQSRWIGASLTTPLIKIPVIRHLLPFLMVILTPISVPFLSVRKAYKVKAFHLFPWMLVFMSARYFGTISGVYKKVYQETNTR